MAKKSTLFYVFISFLLFGIFAIFFPDWVSSPTSIIILAVIFNFIIGTSWKESFKLSVINYVWILIFSLFLITAEMIMTIQGQGISGKGLTWAFFLMLIGIPLTLIAINWNKKRILSYSLLDKILYKVSKNKMSKKNKGNITQSLTFNSYPKPMNKTVQKQLHTFLRDVTAMGGFAASLLIILLFLSSPLLVPLIAGSVLTAVLVILIRIFYFKSRPKKEEYSNLLEKIDASAFPSLHATRIVFLAMLFSVHFANRYLTVLFAFTAVLVSYSRIYLQKHDWIDILGGIAVGAATYFIIIKIF